MRSFIEKDHQSGSAMSPRKELQRSDLTAVVTGVPIAEFVWLWEKAKGQVRVHLWSRFGPNECMSRLLVRGVTFSCAALGVC